MHLLLALPVHRNALEERRQQGVCKDPRVEDLRIQVHRNGDGGAIATAMAACPCASQAPSIVLGPLHYPQQESHAKPATQLEQQLDVCLRPWLPMCKEAQTCLPQNTQKPTHLDGRLDGRCPSDPLVQGRVGLAQAVLRGVLLQLGRAERQSRIEQVCLGEGCVALNDSLMTVVGGGLEHRMIAST